MAKNAGDAATLAEVRRPAGITNNMITQNAGWTGWFFEKRE